MNKFKKNLILIIATGLYTGYFPIAPATFSSLVGILLYYFVRNNIFLFAGTIVLLLPISIITADMAEKFFGKKDSRQITIDEILGILIALFGLPLNNHLVILTFFLFRGFDIIKPYPIRRLQSLKGGLGIIIDDFLAGIYTNLLLRLVLFIINNYRT